MVLKALAVMGHKNSGKTTVIEYLVENFVKDGFRVAAVKHIHHQFTIDTENKDTWRMARRGANIVASISPNEMAVMFYSHDGWENRIQTLKTILAGQGIDIVLFEGFHMVLGDRNDVYKIITFKNSDELNVFLKSVKHPIIAIVNNSGKPMGGVKDVEVFDFSKLSTLYNHVRNRIQL